jgi:serine/threonine protein kinase
MIRLCERKSAGSIDTAPSRTLDIKLIKRKAGLIPPRPIFRELDVNVNLLREVKLLGSGMFGVVKLMENYGGDRFAVKYFERRKHLTNDMLMKALERERESLFKLKHPCIIPIYAVFPPTKDYAAAFVMKYMERGSLDGVLEAVKLKKLPFFWTHTGISIIVCGIVLGLEFIHSRGIVHRDLKPGNLLIDSKGHCRIGDFGSSKIFEGASRWTGGVVGSVQYTAPEQYENSPYSTKIDVFAFGLILYEIVVGKPVYSPYLLDFRVMYKVLQGERAELPSDMSDDVKTLITRCWANKPDDRPSFSEIMLTLERIHFKIFPDVNSSDVALFVSNIREQISKE